MTNIIKHIPDITASNVKDTVVSFAAIVGIYVSLKGLSLWKKQHSWKVQYDLARRILRNTYEYKDWLLTARSPLIFAGECQENNPNDTAEEEKWFSHLECVYQSRMNKVADARRKLAMDILEAEALWGKTIRNLADKLFGFEHDLASAMRRHLHVSKPSYMQRSRDGGESVFNEKHEAVLFSSPGDKYEKELEEAVRRIEELLKPKLRS